MTSSMSGYGGKPFKEKLPHGYKMGAIQNYTDQQLDLHNQLFAHVGPDSYLARLAGGDQSLFDEMEAPALRQFNEQLGGMASRFSGGSGQGSMGLRKSSGFQNATSGAASDFAQQLQANRQGLQRQALQDLMGMSNTLLNQKPYERFPYQKEEKSNSWGSLAGGAIGAIGGAFVGNPIGGAQIGSGIGSLFNKGSSKGQGFSSIFNSSDQGKGTGFSNIAGFDLNQYLPISGA